MAFMADVGQEEVSGKGAVGKDDTTKDSSIRIVGERS